METEFTPTIAPKIEIGETVKFDGIDWIKVFDSDSIDNKPMDKTYNPWLMRLKAAYNIEIDEEISKEQIQKLLEREKLNYKLRNKPISKT